MGMTVTEQRLSPRTTVDLPCTLARRRGNPVSARTTDVSAGGMCVITDRPLTLDEELEFDLSPDVPDHPHGRARVVREQRSNCYALRFEHAVAGMLDWVATH